MGVMFPVLVTPLIPVVIRSVTSIEKRGKKTEKFFFSFLNQISCRRTAIHVGTPNSKEC